MTLAEFRGIKRADDRTEAATGDLPQHEAVVAGERAHPGPLEYAKIGAALGIVTALEVGIYYLDISQGLLIGVLLALSAIKFSLVVMWFMHLRFDSRLFTLMFVGGLALAFSIFIVVLATLSAGLI